MPKLLNNIRIMLIDEGRKILLEKSYSELNMRDIAQKCGIGLGTFYNYFSNKQELVSEIFRNDWSQTLTITENLKYTDEPIKVKLGKIHQSVKGFVDRYMVIFREIMQEDGSRAKKPHDHLAFYTKLQELVEVEIKKGTIKTDLSSEKLSWFLAMNMFFTSRENIMDFDELYEAILKKILE